MSGKQSVLLRPLTLVAFSPSGSCELEIQAHAYTRVKNLQLRNKACFHSLRPRKMSGMRDVFTDLSSIFGPQT